MSLAILFHFFCAQHVSSWIIFACLAFVKYAYQLQQSHKARHIKHTPLHTIIYANAKSSVFTEQYDQCGNSTE